MIVSGLSRVIQLVDLVLDGMNLVKIAFHFEQVFIELLVEQIVEFTL